MRMRFEDRRAFERRGKDLLDFARAYLSEAFPNPDRQGCPPDAALRSLAFNPTEGEPAVTEHLAVCSPCFRRYGELLAEVKSQREQENGFTWGRISVWTKAHPVVAGTAALCLLLIAIGIGLLLRGIRQPNAPPMETNRKPNPTEPRNATVAYLPFGLDLSTLSPVRGSEPPAIGTQRRVSVPNSPLDLTVTLPLASPEGLYDLKLTADNQTFWSKSAEAHLHKGKTLVRLEADFRPIPARNYNLEVRSSSGIRLIQPVSIRAASSKTGEQKP
jgi:hypothetical protein